jgi:hypothetical protein
MLHRHELMTRLAGLLVAVADAELEIFAEHGFSLLTPCLAAQAFSILHINGC